MLKKSFYTLALAGFLLLPAPVWTQSACAATYTMDEAVRQALTANPSLEAAQQGVEAAEYGLKAARSGFGPTVGSSYSYTRYNDQRASVMTLPLPGGPVSVPMGGREYNAYTLGVSAIQPLFTGFNLLNAYQKAALQRDNQELQLKNAQLSITGQVQAQFLNYLKAQENVRSTERSQARAREQMNLAQAAYDVGLRPRLDVLQAELDMTRTEAALIQS
jgi:outer membrane protein